MSFCRCIVNTRLFEPPLMSNGFQLSSDPHWLGWLQPTDPARPMGELKEQYKAQGYLWLKGFLDRDEILAIRRRFFEAFAYTGFDGIYSGKELSSEVMHTIWAEAARLPEYVAFCMSPCILRFYTAFLGGEIYLHKRKIVRFTYPGDPVCTGGHYDLIYLRAGTDQI